MKWNIDKEIEALEALSAAGTAITRTLMDVNLFDRERIKPTPTQIENGHGLVWCLAIGRIYEPKAFFYGQTIREAFLKARKALKASKTKNALVGAWGHPVEVRGFKKRSFQRARRRDGGRDSATT